MWIRVVHIWVIFEKISGQYASILAYVTLSPIIKDEINELT